MNELEPNEHQLIGKWEYIDGKAEADSIANRIEYLIKNVLVKVSSTDDGWTILYQDHKDGRYWELTYPNSDWHGGGPPMLTEKSSI